MNPSSITLIGMPTAGKSYLGERLAKETGLKWVDFDLEIIAKHGTLEKIIKSEGEKALLNYEAEAILSAEPGESIFSCGGSSVYSEKAMQHLQKISRIVYLEIPLEVLRNRVVDYKERGVIGSKDKTLEQLYDERHSLYRKFAHYTVFEDSGDLSRQYNKLLTLTQEIMNDTHK